MQVGVSDPDPDVRGLHPHHEVSGALKHQSTRMQLLCSGLLSFWVGFRFNGKAQRYFERRKKTSLNLTNGLTGSTDLEDSVTCDATAVLLQKGKTQ